MGGLGSSTGLGLGEFLVTFLISFVLLTHVLDSSIGGTTTTTPSKTLTGNLGGIPSLSSASATVTASPAAASSTGTTSSAGLGSTSTSTIIRSQLPKDQPLPQPLADAFENFK